MLALLLVGLRVLQVQGFRVLQVQEFRVRRLPDLLVSSICCFVSSGGVLDEEVGPLVEVETGLNRQASSGRWKSCLSSCQAAK